MMPMSVAEFINAMIGTKWEDINLAKLRIQTQSMNQFLASFPQDNREQWVDAAIYFYRTHRVTM